MPPLVAIDARDTTARELRGWGRYAGRLIAALQAQTDSGLDFRPLRAGGSGPEILFEQLKLPLWLVRKRAALVHCTNCFLPLARPCAGVVTIHDLAFEAWPSDFRTTTRVKYRVLARLAARSAQRIICPSSFTREDLCARFAVDADKVRVIPEAPALAVGSAAPPPPPYVLAVGDLRRKKNLGALVEAFAELHRREGLEHRLVLAGLDAGEGARLRAMAGEAPLEVTGYVADAQLDALMRGADLVVNPSLYEGFGLVVLEAMARGTPVLAARAGALPETGGDAAEYFEPEDPGGLGRGLAALLGDAHQRAELARRGLEWSARFSWERAAAATADVYRELLA